MMDLSEVVEAYSNVNPRHRQMGIAAAVVCLVGGFYYFLFQDQQVKFATMEAEATRLDSARLEKRTYVEHLPLYEARFTDLSHDLDAAKILLPDTADVPQFLALLNNSAREAGMRISRFEPRDEIPREFFSEIVFNLTVSGSYHEIALFIDRISHFERIVNVSDIVMREPKSENDKAIVQGSFDVKTFRFLSEAAVAQLAAEAAAAAKRFGNKK
jgi:type IV pilus assembly protein PilO